MKRRRFLTIAAGTAAAMALPAAAVAANRPELTVWRGTAIGASATLALAHPEADRLIARVRAEIDRLENLFSLYRAESTLVRLNRDGRLAAPAPEMLALLSLSGAVHRATGGAFDPTVQPLWALYATRHAAGRAPAPDEVAEARARTGFDALRIAPDEVAFTRPGMALTLNGIAQGYVADRVAALLASEGLEAALIDMGELRAIGDAPDGGGWPVAIGAPEGARPLPGFRDAALATSAPLGTVFDAEGRVGHILDPRSGRPGGLWPQISVTAGRAAVADALSTALCLLTKAEQQTALAAFPGAKIV